MQKIGERTLSGLFSTGASKLALVGINLTLTAILARLLEPRDFGLVGMVTVFTTLLGMMGSLGFDAAIVQQKTITPRQLTTLFWIKIVVGCLSAGLFFLCAHPISAFYKEPRLVPVTRVLSVIFIISAVYQAHRSLQRRELRFARIARIAVLSVIGSGLIGTGAALSGMGVWSLVVQAITLEVLTAAQYWFASDWRPGIAVSMRETMPLMRFGISMAGGVFAQYLQRNLDILLIGRLLGTVSLGQYTLAYRLMFAPVRHVSMAVTDVLFPAMSRVQDRIDTLQSGFRRSIKWISFLTLPAMSFIALHGESIVVIAFGEQWRTAGKLMMLLAPAGALQSLTQVAYVIFPVVGKPELTAKLGAFNCSLLAACILVGSRWDIWGACWGMLIATATIWLMGETVALRALQLNWRNEIAALRSGLIGCALVILTKFTFQYLGVFSDQSLTAVILNAAAAAAIYAVFFLRAEQAEIAYLVEKMKRLTAIPLSGKAPSAK